MDEAERCGQIAYIYMSKIIIKGTPIELKRLPVVSPAGTRRVSVDSEDPPKGLMAFKKLPFVRDATLVESEIHLLIDEKTSDAEVSKVLTEVGLTASDIRHIEPSLEDVFVTVTQSLEKE
jgi:ABC-type multidrug transport system ATPase subunit